MGCRISLLWPTAVAVVVGLMFARVAYGQAFNGLDEAVRRSQLEQNQQFQRERTIEQAQERARQSGARSVSMDGSATAADALSTTLPQETPCFTVDHLLVEVPDSLPESIRLLGASTLPQDPFRFAQDYLDRFAGMCIGREGINTIVRRLGARILARGHTCLRELGHEKLVESTSIRAR